MLDHFSQLKRSVEAAKIWLCRKMLRIRWTERVKSEEILRKMKTQSKILLRKRQLKFQGHKRTDGWKIHHSRDLFKTRRQRETASNLPKNLV